MPVGKIAGLASFFEKAASDASADGLARREETAPTPQFVAQSASSPEVHATRSVVSGLDRPTGGGADETDSAPQRQKPPQKQDATVKAISTAQIAPSIDSEGVASGLSLRVPSTDTPHQLQADSKDSEHAALGNDDSDSVSKSSDDELTNKGGDVINDSVGNSNLGETKVVESTGPFTPHSPTTRVAASLFFEGTPPAHAAQQEQARLHRQKINQRDRSLLGHQNPSFSESATDPDDAFAALAPVCAIVTGAATPVGKAVCHTLTARRTNLYVLAVDVNINSDFESNDSSAPIDTQRITPLVADITTSEGVALVVENIPMGRVVAIVHCASYVTMGNVADTPASDITRCLRLNMEAPTLLTRALISSIVDDRHEAAPPRVLFLCDPQCGRDALQGPPPNDFTVFAASQAALRVMWQGLRFETRRKGILCGLARLAGLGVAKNVHLDAVNRSSNIVLNDDVACFVAWLVFDTVPDEFDSREWDMQKCEGQWRAAKVLHQTQAMAATRMTNGYYKQFGFASPRIQQPSAWAQTAILAQRVKDRPQDDWGGAPWHTPCFPGWATRRFERPITPPSPSWEHRIRNSLPHEQSDGRGDGDSESNALHVSDLEGRIGESHHDNRSPITSNSNERLAQAVPLWDKSVGGHGDCDVEWPPVRPPPSSWRERTVTIGRDGKHHGMSGNLKHDDVRTSESVETKDVLQAVWFGIEVDGDSMLL